MLLKELAALVKHDGLLKQIADHLEGNAVQGQFSTDEYPVDAQKIEIASAGYNSDGNSVDFTTILTLEKDGIHVHMEGDDRAGEHQSYSVSISYNSPDKMASEIDEIVGSFIHNDMDARNEDDGEDEGYDDDEDDEDHR